MGYKALHKWINRHFPRTGRCELCARTDRVTWYAEARPGLRSRWRHDWFELCVPCHRRYDGWDAGKVTRAKTHCPHGHEYTLENTSTEGNGGRSCRTCRRARKALARAAIT